MYERGSRASTKLQNYISSIQEQYQKNLERQIDQEILYDVARHLHNWETKYDFLELDYNEVKVIKEENSSIHSQRYYYNSFFFNKMHAHFTNYV